MPLIRVRQKLKHTVTALSAIATALDARTCDGARLESVRDLFRGPLDAYPALVSHRRANQLFGWCRGVGDVLEFSVADLLDAYEIHETALRVRRHE